MWNNFVLSPLVKWIMTRTTFFDANSYMVGFSTSLFASLEHLFYCQWQYIVVVLVFVSTSFFLLHWWIIPFFLRLMVVNEKRMQHTLRFVASFRNERFVCFFSLSLPLHSWCWFRFLFSRVWLYSQLWSGMEKWWRSHKNFALKYRFVSVFRLCSVFIYCCSLVLIKSAFAHIKVSQWENVREKGERERERGDKTNALVWWRVDFITCNVQICFRMFCYRILVNSDSVHAFRFKFAICVCAEFLLSECPPRIYILKSSIRNGFRPCNFLFGFWTAPDSQAKPSYV